MAHREWMFQRVTSLNFEELIEGKKHLFDKNQLETLRFIPGEIQKRDVLIAGYLRSIHDRYLLPSVIVYLILVFTPKFRGNDEVKLVMVGACKVGKTSLIKQVVNSAYRFKPDEYHSTLGDHYCHEYTNVMMNRRIRLNAVDTSGNSKYARLTSAMLQDANLVVIVYDITDESSWSFALDMFEQHVTTRAQRAVVIMVGNKLDKQQQRKIPKIMAQSVADKNGMFYFETTATKHNAVLELFQNMVDKVMYLWPNDRRMVL